MKTCKNCRQIVNIETVTCPNCDGHEFKINPVKICSLCGKVNEKKNRECELCGKSFSGDATDYEISTVMNLVSNRDESGLFSKPEAVDNQEETPVIEKTPKERYLAIKAQIESGANEDRCAFFIPSELNQKPIVLLPDFQDSSKVDVYLVLADKEMPKDLGMEKIAISKEEDINALNTKKTPPRKSNIASFFLFWINLAIICAFGLKMVKEVNGFQLIVGLFKENTVGANTVDSLGNFAGLLYPILLGLLAIELIMTLIFIRTESTKGKKVFLILMQSIVFGLAISIYLVNFLMIEDVKWSDIEAGVILMFACGLLAFITSMFYKYPKEKQKKEKQKKTNSRPATQDDDDSQLVGLGYSADEDE